MKTLFVNACVRPESRTMILANHVLKKVGGEIREVNLEKEKIQPLDFAGMKERDAVLETKDYSKDMLKYARQFAGADTIVLAAPYWDLAFPAMVKNYLEAVTVQGVTFHYNEEGIPQGLCKAKRLIYVMTAGGPCEGFNFGYDYVKGLCNLLYGIEDVPCIKAEMLDVTGMDVDGILQKAIDEIEKYL